MRTFWLIRHGESTSNAGFPTKDQSSTELTNKGRQQAQLVANTFTQAPDLIVTSPFIRTQQTAEATRQRFPEAQHEEWPVYEFNSLAHSNYVDTTKFDRRPLARDYWRKRDPHYKDGGEGESFVEVIGRCHDMFQQLRRIDSPFTAVFAHGIFNSLAMWHWLHLESPELSTKRMGYFPYFRIGFDTRNCSYIIGTIDENDKITLSPLQTQHLPTEQHGFRPIRTLASAMVTSAIRTRGQ